MIKNFRIKNELTFTISYFFKLFIDNMIKYLELRSELTFTIFLFFLNCS